MHVKDFTCVIFLDFESVRRNFYHSSVQATSPGAAISPRAAKFRHCSFIGAKTRFDNFASRGGGCGRRSVRRVYSPHMAGSWVVRPSAWWWASESDSASTPAESFITAAVRPVLPPSAYRPGHTHSHANVYVRVERVWWAWLSLDDDGWRRKAC